MDEVMGAILAGGRSSRMGRDKATLLLRDGRMMIEHVAATLAGACGNDLILVAGGTAIDSTIAKVVNMRLIPDLRPQAGPLAGIEAVLASNSTRQYLICPCDVPEITADVLRMLLRNQDAMATVLRIKGRAEFEPLPARITAAALPIVQRLLNENVRSVWRLMETLPAEIIDIDPAHAAAFRNINMPDDLSTA